MNSNWLTLSKERRIEILNQATELTGLPSVAIEKDWWVTMALNASFSLPYSKNIVFKGGTSLSKGWNLIERFSEDIDLAIDRKFFDFYLGVGFEIDCVEIKLLENNKEIINFKFKYLDSEFETKLKDFILKLDGEIDGIVKKTIMPF